MYDRLDDTQVSILEGFQAVTTSLEKSITRAAGLMSDRKNEYITKLNRMRVHEGLRDIAERYLAMSDISNGDGVDASQCTLCDGHVPYTVATHSIAAIEMPHELRLEMESLLLSYDTYIHTTESLGMYRKYRDTINITVENFRSIVEIASVLNATVDLAQISPSANASLSEAINEQRTFPPLIHALSEQAICFVERVSYALNNDFRPPTARRDVLREVFSQILSSHDPAPLVQSDGFVDIELESHNVLANEMNSTF